MFTKDDNLLLAAGIPPELRQRAVHTYRTGSNYTCNPPVTDTDIDMYVLFTSAPISGGGNAFTPKDVLERVCEKLEEAGWARCTTADQRAAYANTPNHGEFWEALRLGNYNVMVVTSYDHFVRCAAATELCKALNLMDKEDRVDIHDTVHRVNASMVAHPTHPVGYSLYSSLVSHSLWMAPSITPTGRTPSSPQMQYLPTIRSYQSSPAMTAHDVRAAMMGLPSRRNFTADMGVFRDIDYVLNA